MNLNTLLDLAIMIFAGMFCGRMAKHVHLPNVTGYLVAGLLIGPSVFGLLSEDFLTTINIISDVALGFIAFSIGNEFKMSYFKRVGVAPIVIACLESLFAVVFVVLGLLIARQPLPFSLVLGRDRRRATGSGCDHHGHQAVPREGPRDGDAAVRRRHR